jgi:hypothetical protein
MYTSVDVAVYLYPTLTLKLQAHQLVDLGNKLKRELLEYILREPTYHGGNHLFSINGPFDGNRKVDPPLSLMYCLHALLGLLDPSPGLVRCIM